MESQDILYWSIALGAGAVVLVVAVWLLETFTRLVERIHELSERIWRTGKDVAGNTATTWLLHETSDRLDHLTNEAGRHGELLGVRETGAQRAGDVAEEGS